MSNVSVRAALEGRLATWAAARTPALTVTWENLPADPVTGTAYLRAFLLPAPSRSEDLAGAHLARLGVFQVTVVAPLLAGPGAAAGIADELATLFPVNGRYTSGAVTVQTLTPMSPAPAQYETNAYTLPVSLQYRADTT